MSRLFDSAQAPAAAVSEDRHERARAAVVAAEVDENAQRLEKLLGGATAVTPIQYLRERHGRWIIEHGRADDDYLFHLHPLKVPARPWQDVMTGFIAAMDTLFPRSVQIHYRRPDETWEVKFFTIRAEGLCRLPGWEPAMKKGIDRLAEVNAW